MVKFTFFYCLFCTLRSLQTIFLSVLIKKNFLGTWTLFLKILDLCEKKFVSFKI